MSTVKLEEYRNIRYRVRPGGSSMANDIRQSMEWMVSSGSRYCSVVVRYDGGVFGTIEYNLQLFAS